MHMFPNIYTDTCHFVLLDHFIYNTDVQSGVSLSSFVVKQLKESVTTAHTTDEPEEKSTPAAPPQPPPPPPPPPPSTIVKYVKLKPELSWPGWYLMAPP